MADELTHSSLADLFTDIAEAIQAKTGDDTPIVADEFPSAITAIPQGSSVTVEPLSVTANGTWADEGKAYSPVTVNVQSGVSFTDFQHFCEVTYTAASSSTNQTITIAHTLGVVPKLVVMYQSDFNISSNAFLGMIWMQTGYTATASANGVWTIRGSGTYGFDTFRNATDFAVTSTSITFQNGPRNMITATPYRCFFFA